MSKCHFASKVNVMVGKLLNLSVGKFDYIYCRMEAEERPTKNDV